MLSKKTCLYYYDFPLYKYSLNMKIPRQHAGNPSSIIDIQHSCSVTLVSISVANTIEIMRKKYNNEDGEDTPIECSVDAYRPRCLLPVLLVFFFFFEIQEGFPPTGFY
jgi:hypothetical protein